MLFLSLTLLQVLMLIEQLPQQYLKVSASGFASLWVRSERLGSLKEVGCERAALTQGELFV